MQPMKKIRDFGRDQKGATAVEFAVVAVVFLTLLMGIIEYGMIMLTRVALESATVQVGRTASLGKFSPGCSDRKCEIQQKISEKTAGLLNPESVSVSAVVVSAAGTSSPRIPDICLENTAVPYPPTCEFWHENSGPEDAYNPPPPLTDSSVGDDTDGALVEIRVTYLWRVLFPIMTSYFGEDGVVTISTSTVIKNEPF